MDRRIVLPLAALALLVVCAFAALCINMQSALRAAPAGKPTPDVVIGELIKRTDGPVVELRGAEAKTYWLVFERPADESRLAGFETGTRVRVKGQLAAGGTYRYVIFGSIDADE